MSSSWTAHKFGGTSLADASGFRRAADLVTAHGDGPQAVTVSAAAGTTDSLISLVHLAARGEDFAQALGAVRDRQAKLARDLLDEAAGPLIASLDSDLADVRHVLDAASVMESASDRAIGVVAGHGELWSARLLAALLSSTGARTTWLDAREILFVERQGLVPVVDWDRAAAELRERLDATPLDFVVITGFIASDRHGRPTTLGRNGSDLSASIFGALLEADEIVIWTDVDGVMTADPRLVPNAHVVERLSYDEAMELAYFGAEVIHPWTMGPAVRLGIPIVIRNTFNPVHPGTTIAAAAGGDLPVKGFASVDDIALLNLEGTAMIGVPGISERLFGALRAEGVSVIMISQASSEHSICFAVPEGEAEAARSAVTNVFDRESRFGQIQDLEVTGGCTILAAVGDGMSGTPGIAARLFGALARVGVNVRAIAQGSSERNISVVIDGADASRALRAAHSGFYLSDQTLAIGLIGPGHVGAALLDQMAKRSGWLRDSQGVELRLRAIARSREMVLDSHIDLESWREALSSDEAMPTDFTAFTNHVQTEDVPHAVIIDCTAEDEVADMYLGWLKRGIHVITPNKRAGSGAEDIYLRLRRHARESRAQFLYETTVGAALPVVKTARDLVQTGDQILRIEGVFSGTLSYLFNTYDGATPFSTLVAQAREKGYTEPDPREDLSGMDVARKVVILAREIGMSVHLDDLEVAGLVPAGLEGLSVEEFLDRFSEFDGEMLELFEEARSKGEVLRFVGIIDPRRGCQVDLRSYPTTHPLAGTSSNDNIVRFETVRYSDNPLVIRGPGAGPDLTAGGVFADLLRLAGYLGAPL